MDRTNTESCSLKTLGSIAFVHDLSSKFDKFDLRDKKCIFIKYPEHFKGYVFIDKKAHVNISKLKSRNFTFLQNDFAQRGDITSDSDIFDINESNTCIAPFQPIQPTKDNNEKFHPSESQRNIQIPQEE